MVTELSSSTRWLVALITSTAELPPFTERVAGRDVERGVHRQIRAVRDRVKAGAGEAVGEAGAVVDVGREPRMQRQIGREARIERFALVVIDGEVIKSPRSQAGSPGMLQVNPPMMAPRCSAI